jgi:hypothetical protein
MRDPDLVLQAQRAAVALEQAWDRYRTLQGFGAEPMPAISSYVGYSLEEPWGQPRVVFGVAADEAEQLASLLEAHDYEGPASAGPGLPGAELAEEPDGAVSFADQGASGGHVHVPAQPQPGPAKRGRAKDPARSERPRGNRGQPRLVEPQATGVLRPLDVGSAPDPGNGRGSGSVLDSGNGLGSGSVLDSGSSLESGRQLGSSGPLGPGSLRQAGRSSDVGMSPGITRSPGLGRLPSVGRMPTIGSPFDSSARDPEPPAASQARAPIQPIGMHAGPVSYAAPAPAPDGADLMAFRPRHEPASYLDEGPESDPFMTEPDGPVSSWRGRGRVAGSHAMPRQKRPSAAPSATGGFQSASRPLEGSGRRGITSVAAEVAGWASSELPGQASHRLAPNAPVAQYRPAGDTAAFPNGGMPTDTVY